MNEHDGPGVIPGRYAGPAIAISAGPTPQELVEVERKAAADRLAGQICAAASVSAQATCSLLELVGEFDATGALRYWADVKSVAHWLSWTCSMAPGAAREHVRVARALRRMPTILAEFRAGRLSYSKVREVSRVVDVIDEAKLAAMAKTATAAQLATMIAAFRSCDSDRLRQEDRRSVSWYEREDGMVSLRARLTKEDAAVLVAAVRAAKEQFGRPTEGADGVGAYTLTDALVDVGRVFLDTAPEDRSGEDRTLVTVHVSAELLGDSDPATATATAEQDVPAGTSKPEANTCHIAGQGSIAPETAQRLACDNPILPAVIGLDGAVLALGRTGRLVSRAQRRALMIRDRMCQYPGCAQTRHLKAHHIRSWAAGGPTDLDNLILVCQFHHTAVHEGNLRISRTEAGWQFWMPDGQRCRGRHIDQFLPQQLAFQLREARAKIAAVDRFNHPDARPIQPGWAGERFDVHECVRALLAMKLPVTPDVLDRDHDQDSPSAQDQKAA